MSRMPTFSVVTAVLNCREYLEGCLQSVAAQGSELVEHVVVDGGSSDGGVSILQRWSDQLAYWESGPDKGIGDAINKGISKANGKWILVLHADDELLGSGSLKDVAGALEKTDALVVGFPILFGSANRRRAVRPRGADARLLLKTGFLHQATFVHRSVYEQIGLYDTSLRVAMDYEFFLRAWRLRVPMTTFSEPIPTWMRDTGVSSRKDWDSLSKRFGEERAIHFKHADRPLQIIAYRAYWAAYLPYRRLLAMKVHRD